MDSLLDEQEFDHEEHAETDSQFSSSRSSTPRHVDKKPRVLVAKKLAESHLGRSTFYFVV